MSTSRPGSSPGCGSGDVIIRVRLGVAQAPVCVRAGSRIVVHLPPNPMGVWTAPGVSDPAVLEVATARAPGGVTVAIAAVAAGHATVTSVTTPSGDPRPHGPRLPTWRLAVTVS